MNNFCDIKLNRNNFSLYLGTNRFGKKFSLVLVDSFIVECGNSFTETDSLIVF